MAEKKKFKIVRAKVETAIIEAHNKEMVEALLEFAPGGFAWESGPRDEEIFIEEIPVKDN